VIVLHNVELFPLPGRHEIVIEDRKIREIRAPSANRSASVVHFENAIAFPGLINSHDHLEFDCYPQLAGGPYQNYIEWAAAMRKGHSSTVETVEAVPRRTRIRLGIARNLLCGVTAVAHHGNSEDDFAGPIEIIANTRTIHSPRLGKKAGMLVPNRTAIVVHVGEGVDRESEREIDHFLRWNVWRAPLVGIHAIAMRPDQALRFEAIVWCPVSNEFLYGRTARVSELKKRSRILFGTDSTLTGSWNIWEHVRRARNLGLLTDAELIASLTTQAAKQWGLQGCGQILPGANADLTIVRKNRDQPTEAFFATNPRDVLMVLKNGKVVLADGELRAQLPDVPRLFQVAVDGTSKFSTEDYSELAVLLRASLPSIPVPVDSWRKP
jgi:cytosine/adenosine deaminase-related metal-dependent hydrolase